MKNGNTIALAGNPNSGKTTLFNRLTGARQHVGNYPGVTVEKKEGTYRRNGIKLHIVDLPGTYSLTAYSVEEVVARDFLVNEKPAVVVNIVDASNLERNLYLTTQFLELGIPVCIALNMMDVAKGRGLNIDTVKLSELMGVPVVPTIARSGKGNIDLMTVAADLASHADTIQPLKISYGADIDGALQEIEARIVAHDFLTDTYPMRWLALKYLEQDRQILEKGRRVNPELARSLEAIVEKVAAHLDETLDTYPEAVIADHRYGYISAIMKQGVLKRQYDTDRLHTSDQVDRVLTNRFLGPIIMAGVILGLYHFTFTYSELPVTWLETFFDWLGNTTAALLPDGLLQSLLVSGIIDGVGGVLGFVPLIMFMFFGIALLEDSGYLARVAFMLDRVFRIFGLHGSSVMAFIVSGGIAGGCAVPGVMATRTLKSRRERLATLLTVPFMNCGAKLPVLALLIGIFFAEQKAMLMFLFTIIAWLGALVVAKLLRVTVIRGHSTPFVMELPPYRLPTFKGLAIHTWERTWQYIKKAGTVILGISIILWAMMTFPRLSDTQLNAFERQRTAILQTAPAPVAAQLAAADEDAALTPAAQALKERLARIDGQQAETALRHSIAGRMGTAIETITRFAGFDWRTNIALIGGFAAKEVVVSTLGTAYSLGEIDPEGGESLADTLAAAPHWNPLVALSLIIFVMFYSPCFVSVACIAREAGSWKWGAFAILFNTILAFSLSVGIFQFGKTFGILNGV